MPELTQYEADLKLKSSRNMLNILGLNNSVQISQPKRITTRPKGTFSSTNPIPPAIKSTVAVLTRLGEENVSVARTFGMAARTSYAIENGTTTVPEDKVQSELSKIREKVTNIVHKALDNITDDKLANNSAALNSTIIKNLFPMIDDRKSEELGNQPQVVVYAPTMRDERTYNIVEV